MKTIEEYIKTLSLEEKASQLYQTAAIYLKATEAENTGVVDGIYLSKEQLYNVGSILNFSNVSGTIVPKIEAKITTANNDNDTAKVITMLSKKNRL